MLLNINQKLLAILVFGKPLRPFRNYTQEIGLLYIRKDFQKLGIGKKLFNLTYSHIQSTGVDNFFISCHKYNTIMSLFFMYTIIAYIFNKKVPIFKYVAKIIHNKYGICE